MKKKKKSKQCQSAISIGKQKKNNIQANHLLKHTNLQITKNTLKTVNDLEKGQLHMNFPLQLDTPFSAFHFLKRSKQANKRVNEWTNKYCLFLPLVTRSCNVIFTRRKTVGRACRCEMIFPVLNAIFQLRYQLLIDRTRNEYIHQSYYVRVGWSTMPLRTAYRLVLLSQ